MNVDLFFVKFFSHLTFIKMYLAHIKYLWPFQGLEFFSEKNYSSIYFILYLPEISLLIYLF